MGHPPLARPQPGVAVHGLAPAPAFAVMVLLTSVAGGGRPEMLCSAMQHTSPLSGMVPMYLLMSAFHTTPWLKLVSSRLAHPFPGLSGAEQK
jgi:hypothetical protein